MSKTLVTPILLILFALAAAVALSIALTPAGAATGPDLTISKLACATHVSPGDPICFQIVVENSGPADSSQVHTEDDLPGAALWHITANTLGCDLTTDANPGNHQALICDVEGIQQRHLNASASDFVNGSAAVEVDSIAGACGSTYTNYGASLDDAKDAIHLTTGIVTITVDGPSCATPTPTSTPTASPTTPAPSPTPTTPVSTPTPLIIVIHDTPTPGAVSTPKPPNTGTGSDVRYIAPKSQAATMFGLSTGAGLIALGTLVAAALFVRRRRA